MSFSELGKKVTRIRRNDKLIDDLSDSTEFRTYVSLADNLDELDGAITRDEFEKEVDKKTQELSIGRQEAEAVIFLDLIIKKKGSKDAAFMYILSKMTLDESKILLFVNDLVSRGANISATASDLKTPLHYAALRNFKGVAAKLLENGAIPHARDKDGRLPLHIAMTNKTTNKNDEMCALLLKYMPNSFVRNMYIAHGMEDAELSFRDLLKPFFQETLLSVLDCMIENRGRKDNIRVYYNILDADDKGRDPYHPLFDPTSKSPYQLISEDGHESIVYHDAVRVLTRRKWMEFAFFRFKCNAFVHILTLFSITYSAVVAAGTPDPTVYNNALQISRGVFEAFSLFMVLIQLIAEIFGLKRDRLDYFWNAFNWIDLSSSVLLLSVPPLRFTYNQAQWHVFAFGYLIWVIRIFEFAAVFRQTGAYAQLLYHVLVHDLTRFGILFLVILLAFSGAFFLFLRGEYGMHTHKETRTLSTIFMVVFLFGFCVILLNILIAQLSDTYQRVQQNTTKSLEIHHARVVCIIELKSVLRKDFRMANYTKFEDINAVFPRWKPDSPIKEMNKHIRGISDSIGNHKMNLQHRMTILENSLRKISDNLTTLTELLTNQITATGSSRPEFNLLTSYIENQTTQSELSSNQITDTGSSRPVFYRSDTEGQLIDKQDGEQLTRHKPNVTKGVSETTV